MKYIYKKFYLQGAALLIMLISVVACTTMDEGYNKFLKGGEISYTGKIDSLEIFSGKNRVKVKGLFISDPKITECRVFWNSGADSIVVPIARTEGVDTLDIIINDLEENIYSFDVRTYDALGNKSISVSEIGTSYGERYQKSLFQRPVISNEIIGGALTIEYASMDLSSGVFGTEVNYIDVNDSQKSIIVPIDSSNVVIEDFKGGTEYAYRTLFLPDETCIDTFSTDFTTHKPLLEITLPPYFKNASIPFAKVSDKGRWSTPAEWVVNEGAKSHSGEGGLDNDIFNLESGWGQPDIINGKVYQRMNLPPGTYAYTINIKETNYEGADNNLDQAYFIVAEGGDLPDVSDAETSESTIVYERVNKVNGLTRTLVFTLTKELTQIVIGVETTNDKGAGRYLKINSFSLNQFTEAPYFKNASAPFDKVFDNGRWSTPADWVVNEGAKSHGGQGGLDGDLFNLESGWGAPPIINGKIYQTMFLEAGTYTYGINIKETNYEGAIANKEQAYFVVAKGSTLPDVIDVETSSETIVYERINKDNGVNRSLGFTLTEAAQVSIGVETTNADNSYGRYLKINSFTLTKN
ncbi:hypothetical protein CJ739_2406 [Mariniflexile rhizosphaerae]|uniref:DUF4998 domain-containing protein n=1 Tax=unclassified Mariniflexile TaxID=2643887 RepID=UPI000E331891|nr:DUF4998 domain-containing protein [Mariniflexile sp. TRM1-10]AXP81479.1 hypothetical protein CJ739_2406 [Mariniflexile sp. TRM1-10]